MIRGECQRGRRRAWRGRKHESHVEPRACVMCRHSPEWSGEREGCEEHSCPNKDERSSTCPNPHCAASVGKTHYSSGLGRQGNNKTCSSSSEFLQVMPCVARPAALNVVSHLPCLRRIPRHFSAFGFHLLEFCESQRSKGLNNRPITPLPKDRLPRDSSQATRLHLLKNSFVAKQESQNFRESCASFTSWLH